LNIDRFTGEASYDYVVPTQQHGNGINCFILNCNCNLEDVLGDLKKDIKYNIFLYEGKSIKDKYFKLEQGKQITIFDK